MDSIQVLEGRLARGVNIRSSADDSHGTRNDEQVLYTKRSRRERVAGGGGEVWEGKLPCIVHVSNFSPLARMPRMAAQKCREKHCTRQQHSNTANMSLTRLAFRAPPAVSQNTLRCFSSGPQRQGAPSHLLRGSSESCTEAQQIIPPPASSTSSAPATSPPASSDLEAPP